MAKDKEKDQKKKELVNLQEPKLQPELVPSEPQLKKDDDKPYTTLPYAGHPLYRCKQCPYDAFEVETVLEHIRTRHTPEAPEPTILVADKSGKQVKGN